MKLASFLQKRFTYLNTAKIKWTYIIGSALFVHFFLIVFQPYGLYEVMRSHQNPMLHKFLFFFQIGISTVIGLYISQFVLRPLAGFQQVSIKKYSIWYGVDALLITIVSFALSFLIPDLGDNFEEELNIWFQLNNYFRAMVVLLFPFFGTVIYEFISRLHEELNELDTQLKQYQNLHKHSAENLEMFHVKDENENEVFSISATNFLYAESGNQYVIVYYLSKEEIKKEIIRNRLKNILAMLPQTTVYQCHRSYIVNLMQVEHLIKKDGKNYLTLYTDESIKIPVSKSFLDSITNQILVN